MRCGFNEKIALCFLSVALLLKKEVVKKFLGGTKIREAKFTGSIALNAYNDISKIRKNPVVGTFFRIKNLLFSNLFIRVLENSSVRFDCTAL